LQDGYSTSGRLGLGLPGVAALDGRLPYRYRPWEGTTVTVKKWRGSGWPLDWSVAFARLGRRRLGDGYFVQAVSAAC